MGKVEVRVAFRRDIGIVTLSVLYHIGARTDRTVRRTERDVAREPDSTITTALAASLARLESLHARLCPRQVLGARIGLYAGDLLGLPLPQQDKRMLAFVETDGCAIDGIAVATGCTVGRRTMRVLDFGKVAATFADTATGRAVRISPQPGARARADATVGASVDHWQAMLLAYQSLPAEELLRAEWVTLTVSLAEIVSRPGLHRPCDRCGEEIMNEREVTEAGAVVCRGCAGGRYYAPVTTPA